MKYSVIGSNGFLSNAIGQFCNEVGCELDIYGRNEPKKHFFHNFYKIDLLHEKLNYHELVKSDVIIYSVGAGIQANLREDSSLIYALNLLVPISISNELVKLNYQGKFITFGSVFEMGEVTGRSMLSEGDIISSKYKCSSDYSISKRLFTNFINSYKHEFVHYHFIIPTIYGEHENPLRLIPYTINAIKSKQKLSFTSGDQVRQYVYVNDIPRIIQNSEQKKMPSGIYNIANTEIYTVKEIVTKIHDHFGVRLPEDCFGKLSRTDVGMKYLALDGTKLSGFLNFTSLTEIEQIIKNY